MPDETASTGAEQSVLNIADCLSEMAAVRPHQRALIFPHGRDQAGRVAYTQLSFKQLEELCHNYAHGLHQLGIGPGTRTLLMVRPGLDFTALTFALFKLGAVPVMIDPGMGIGSFIRCVKQVKPEALLGIPAAHLLRLVLRPYFHSVKIPVVLGRRRFFAAASTARLLRSGRERGRFPTAATSPDDMAAILFTTGSTGPAKGVVYTHRIFAAQLEILRSIYNIGPDDIDLPCFPLFSLFSTALGACAVIPEMDPTRPAAVKPERIVEAIENHAVTCSFGSPALWRSVTGFCRRNRIKFTTLKKILMAGAPIPDYIHERLLHHILEPDGETRTPYGATEALPVADISGHEVLRETWEKTRNGAGVCVGRPMPGLRVEIIRTTDEPIERWHDSLTLAPGEIGEITVKGPVVTPEYYNRPEQTKLAKMYHHDGSIWHRMGDLGYFDESGRLWVCGRKSHRVTTSSGVKFSLCCEAIFNQHEAVYRSALAGIPGDDGINRAAIVLEPEPGKFPKSQREKAALKRELMELGRKTAMTSDIDTFLLCRSFPVDIRHNAKIKREILAQWATKQNRRGRKL